MLSLFNIMPNERYNPLTYPRPTRVDQYFNGFGFENHIIIQPQGLILRLVNLSKILTFVYADTIYGFTRRNKVYSSILNIVK